jgi:uroporphyrin-3 C-methyltransferase
MDDLTTSPAVAAPEERRARSGNAWKWLLAIVVLAAAAFAFWWTSRGARTDAPDPAQQFNSQVESLMHSVTQIRGATDTLRSRLDDGDKVDKSIRDQIIGLSERARLLEDAMANLSNKRLSGHDVLALDEAELLLTMGGERFNLFRDPAGAIAAYRAADTALSEVEDAAFSTVRQSINAEIAALTSLQAADPALVGAQLDQLRVHVAQLSAPKRLSDSAEPSDSRLMRVLGAMVQVHHDDDPKNATTVTDTSLARQLAALDIRDAQAAAFARDATHYKDALSATRAQIAAAFDTDAAAPVLAQIDTLEKAPLAPPPPSILGASLKELRNLRASHALRASSGTAIPPEALKAPGDTK